MFVRRCQIIGGGDGSTSSVTARTNLCVASIRGSGALSRLVLPCRCAAAWAEYCGTKLEREFSVSTNPPQQKRTQQARDMLAATIIPIAGGKGGVGKTIIASSLAGALAARGYATVVADLDLGGSNLHTLLGHQNRYPSIGDFIATKGAQLEDYLVPSGRPNLSFLTGEGRTPFMANMSAAHKAKLLRHLLALPAKYVLLDLGSGTSFNTLDFFRVVARGIVVTTTERTALMNLLSFLKNVLLRDIDRAMRRNGAVCAALKALYREHRVDDKLTMARIIKTVHWHDPDAALTIRERCAAMQPCVVMNMARHPRELALLDHIDAAARSMLNLDLIHLGFLCDDPTVHEAASVGRPLMDFEPPGLAMTGITHLAGRIIRRWHDPLDNSATRLRAYAWNFYETYVEPPAANDLTLSA